MDKIKQVKTVVNKVNEIDNTYRNFQFEVIGGENNTNVICKENTCSFKFDFANVYWNPRLSTEHERIVALINENDVVYDVFAGVGPFSVPAAIRKKAIVVANDLNPNSYKFLVENYDLNRSNTFKQKEATKKRTNLEFYKIFNDKFEAFNMDGKDFIKNIIRNHLIKCFKSQFFNTTLLNSKFHVVMNLPAIAIEFLNSFNNLFAENQEEIKDLIINNERLNQFKLNVACYCFCKNDEELQIIKSNILTNRLAVSDNSIQINNHYVRQVAPNKQMHCLQFQLPIIGVLCKNINDNDENGQVAKKLKIDN